MAVLSAGILHCHTTINHTVTRQYGHLASIRPYGQHTASIRPYGQDYGQNYDHTAKITAIQPAYSHAASIRPAYARLQDYGHTACIRPYGQHTTIRPYGHTAIRPAHDHTAIKPSYDHTSIRPYGQHLAIHGQNYGHIASIRPYDQTASMRPRLRPYGQHCGHTAIMLTIRLNTSEPCNVCVEISYVSCLDDGTMTFDFFILLLIAYYISRY